MSPSSSPPASSAPPRASAINSLVQKWRRQHDLPIRGTSFHYDPPTGPPHPPTTCSVPCPRFLSPPPPLPPPPDPQPDNNTPEPLQKFRVEPSPPEISISDWQVEEKSPALYVFLKDAPTPPLPSPLPPPPQVFPPCSTQHGNSHADDADENDDNDDDSPPARHDPAPRLQKSAEKKLWHRNGRMLDALDILLDELAAATAAGSEKVWHFDKKKRKGLRIMFVRKI